MPVIVTAFGQSMELRDPAIEQEVTALVRETRGERLPMARALHRLALRAREVPWHVRAVALIAPHIAERMKREHLRQTAGKRMTLRWLSRTARLDRTASFQLS